MSGQPPLPLPEWETGWDKLENELRQAARAAERVNRKETK
jgi:hypothetical protein